MSMVIYLAGPVRGHEDYQEKFHEAEMALVGKGWVVLNPARLPRGMDEKKYMPICMAMLAQADAIFLLDGWETSQGANVELRFAECQGMYVYVNMPYVPTAESVENGESLGDILASAQKNEADAEEKRKEPVMAFLRFSSFEDVWRLMGDGGCEQ